MRNATFILNCQHRSLSVTKAIRGCVVLDRNHGRCSTVFGAVSGNPFNEPLPSQITPNNGMVHTVEPSLPNKFSIFDTVNGKCRCQS